MNIPVEVFLMTIVMIAGAILLLDMNNRMR
jgi:hypothetical protein